MGGRHDPVDAEGDPRYHHRSDGEDKTHLRRLASAATKLRMPLSCRVARGQDPGPSAS